MSLHSVRFQSGVGIGTNYRLLCEIDHATLSPQVSDITFLSEKAVGKRLQSSGLEWDGDEGQMLFGKWLYVTSRQLQRLGFSQLPTP